MPHPAAGTLSCPGEKGTPFQKIEVDSWAFPVYFCSWRSGVFCLLAGFGKAREAFGWSRYIEAVTCPSLADNSQFAR